MAVSKTKYAYAVGRVRVLETRLLDKGKFDRMLEATSAGEVLKVLAETSYSSYLAELTGAYEFETILRKEMANVLADFEKMSPQPELVALIALSYDLHNLKVLFKNKYLGVENTDILFPAGAIPLHRLKYAVEDENFREFPEVLRRAGEQILDEFVVSRDPQLIDLYLDRALFELRLTSAQKARSGFLEGLFQRQVDLLNLNTFLRVKKMGRSKDFLKQALLPGGLIAGELLLELLDESLEELISRLSTTRYSAVSGEGIREWMDTGTATRLEKLSDDFITAYLQRGRHSPFGLEPLIGYLWAKQVEIKNIRLVMVGKINGLPTEAIRERLRNVYL
ncbi:MAG TPA: V-type ATP synthase subunit C [Firmicutes bacterium]|nr:V-type ATP synthase subunit C [Bacillota bacterium]